MQIVAQNRQSLPDGTLRFIFENRAVIGKKMPLEESRGVTINQRAVVMLPLTYEFLRKSTNHFLPMNFPVS